MSKNAIDSSYRSLFNTVVTAPVPSVPKAESDKFPETPIASTVALPPLESVTKATEPPKVPTEVAKVPAGPPSESVLTKAQLEALVEINKTQEIHRKNITSFRAQLFEAQYPLVAKLLRDGLWSTESPRQPRQKPPILPDPNPPVETPEEVEFIPVTPPVTPRGKTVRRPTPIRPKNGKWF